MKVNPAKPAHRTTITAKYDTSGRITYTVREVATLLGVAEITVRRGIALGTIPSIRIMGCVKIPKAAFDRLFG